MNAEEITKLDLAATRLVAQRCQAELERNKAEVIEAKLAAADDAKIKTALRAVVDPTKEHQAAAQAAAAEVDKVLAEVASRAALVRGLDETLLAANRWSRRLLELQGRANLDAGLATARAKLSSRSVESLSEHISEAALVAFLDGCHYLPNDIDRVLQIYAGVDLAKIFDEAQDRATQIKKGTVEL